MRRGSISGSTWAAATAIAALAMGHLLTGVASAPLSTALILTSTVLAARCWGWGPCVMATALGVVGQAVLTHASGAPIAEDEVRHGLELAAFGLLLGTIITAKLPGRVGLREGETRYRQMFERNRAVQIVVDPDSKRILEANPAASDFYGYSSAKLRTMHIGDINTASSETIEHALATVRSGEKLVLEFNHRLASGEIREVEVQSSLLEVDGSQRLYSIIHDITDRKRSERALRENELLLRQGLAAAHMATWRWDLVSGRITWSDGMERLLELEPGRFDGTYASFLTCVHPDDREVVHGAIQAALTTDNPYFVEHRVLHGSEGVRWVADAGQVQRDEMGVPVLMIGVSMDITVRKQLEDQLRQAQKMEAIGQLAGGIAHDFNNMLAVIMGHCQLLSRQLPDGHVGRRHLEVAIRAAESSARLTAQLLAFGRRQHVELLALDLNRVVDETVEMLRHTLGAQVRIVVHLETGLPQVIADSRQIQQVLMNLCLNGRDAMPNGGVVTIVTRTLTLDAVRSVRSGTIPVGRWCALEVSDQGCGMSEQVQSRLFEPFFTTKPQGKGTGMGLSTVYGIVTHGMGYLDVISAPGQGSRFIAYLPVSTASSTQAEEMPVPEPLPSAVARRQVLVVDDQPDVRMLAQTVLEDLGYEVLTAASGDQALAIVRGMQGRLSLLITDLAMPGMSGRELRDRLVQIHPELPTLFISAYGDREDLAAIVGQNRAGFLPKPFALDEFASKVGELMLMVE